MEIKKRNIINGMLLIIYKIFLEIIYVKLVVPKYGYSGFENNFVWKYYFFYWVLFLFFLPTIISLYKREEPSSYILLIFLLVGFIPGIVIQSFMPQSILFTVLFITYWVTMLFFYYLLPKVSFNLNFQNDNIVYTVTLFLCLLVVFISWKYANFRINLDLLNVYELRDLSREFNMPSALTYGFSAAKVCLPILFVYFIEKNKMLFAAVIGFIQLLAFSVDGSKSTIFSIFITYFIYKFIKKISIERIATLLVGVSLVSLIEPLILKTDYLILFFVRRAMFLPNLLHFYYFDFFSVNSKDYFSQGFLRRFGIDSVYETPIPNIIGYNFSGSSTMIANNGLFSDAYFNLGMLGVLLLPLLIIVTLKLFDACSEGIDIKILIAAIITASYTFVSSSFFTVLLTHGFLLTCIVLLLVPKNTGKEKK